MAQYDLDMHLSDGRLTEPAGIMYDIREILKKEQELGRPLTPDELELYAIKENTLIC